MSLFDASSSANNDAGGGEKDIPCETITKPIRIVRSTAKGPHFHAWHTILTCRWDIVGAGVVGIAAAAGDDDVAAAVVRMAVARGVAEPHMTSCVKKTTPDFAYKFPHPCESFCKTCSLPESSVRGPQGTDPEA